MDFLRSVNLHLGFWCASSEAPKQFGNPMDLANDLKEYIDSSRRADFMDLKNYRLVAHANVALFDVKEIDLKVNFVIFQISVKLQQEDIHKNCHVTNT